MKKISILLAGLLIVLSLHAQSRTATSAVTITVNGNRNLQIAIDGKDYNLTNKLFTDNKTTISLTDIEVGQHTFQVMRTDLNGNRSERIVSTFNLRYGYDMLITINGNGSIELIEKLNWVSDNRSPMNSTAFNSLLKNVKLQRSVNGRRSLIAGAFNNTNNYFSTSQVVQMLQQVNAENFRLQLAKLSYRGITDKGNFNQVYELLNSQASENELRDYVNNYREDNTSNTAMTDASFTALRQTIQQQWPVSTQLNSATNAFNNSNNYFTVYQARQLIQLFNAENDRLQLAKLSYRSITDPANFSQLNNLFNRQASKDELAAYVNNYFNNNPNTAMSDDSFTILYQGIQQQWPVSTQLNSLNNAFTNSSNFFTSSQARQLIQLSNGESNRLQLAKLSYRTITDRNNFNQLYELLGNQSSKDELTTYINNYTGNMGSVVNTPMTDANFTTFYQALQRQYLPGEQMVSLTNAFNNTSNYFTTAQVKQLIPLVSNESNRLQLAKLSYRIITDRGNFSQLYDLLSSQASRNELEVYVNAYKE